MTPLKSQRHLYVDTTELEFNQDNTELEFSQEDTIKPLPASTVCRVITENFPPGFTFEKEVGQLMVKCGTEFVVMVSSVGYEFAEKEGMTTIAPRHIIAALEDLGYAEYVDEIKELAEQLKINSKQKKLDKKKRTGFNQSGFSEEELLRQQTELFGAAREKFILKEGRDSANIM